MGQYDFTYEFPSDFEGRVVQILQQEFCGVQVASAFQRCHYEYDEKGLAFYAGMKGGDYWNKHALDFTLEGTKTDIDFLKSNQKVLLEALGGALRTSISGFVVRKILYLHNEMSSLPTSDEQRISADLSAANSVLNDLIKIGERVCSNITYRKNSPENSINDFFRDSLSLMGYSEVRDQTRHGISTSGKDSGEVDILINKGGKEIAIFEGLKLGSVNTSYIDRHIDKSIINYNALGTATFIVAYASVHNFESFWSGYFTHLQNYKFPLQVKRQLYALTAPNAAIRIAEIVLSRDGFDFPVFFIALNVG